MSVSTSRPPRKWRILLADQDTAEAQMAFDAQLAQQAGATIRLFQWKRPSVSVGFKQRPPAWVHPASLSRQGIELVERPTGGGIAIHGSDLSFSVVAPHDPQLPLEAFMQGVADALKEGMSRLDVQASWTHHIESHGRIDYCLTDESPYALMIEGRKLCGLAVRRYPVSWLAQGSLLVRELPEVFAQVMPEEVRSLFQTRAITLEQAAGRPVDVKELVSAVTGGWLKIWGDV